MSEKPFLFALSFFLLNFWAGEAFTAEPLSRFSTYHAQFSVIIWPGAIPNFFKCVDAWFAAIIEVAYCTVTIIIYCLLLHKVGLVTALPDEFVEALIRVLRFPMQALAQQIFLGKRVEYWLDSLNNYIWEAFLVLISSRISLETTPGVSTIGQLSCIGFSLDEAMWFNTARKPSFFFSRFSLFCLMASP